MSGVGGLLELYWNFIGVDRNFIGTVSLRYCYVIATLLLRYCYVIGGRSGLDRGCPIYGAPPSVVAPEFIGGPTSLPTGIRGPLGCNFLSRECFCSKETLEEHLAQDATRVFLWYKTLTREKITAQWARLPVGRWSVRLLNSGATT